MFGRVFCGVPIGRTVREGGGDVFSGAVSEARRDENERGGEAFFLPSHPPRASLSIDSLYPFLPLASVKMIFSLTRGAFASCMNTET